MLSTSTKQKVNSRSLTETEFVTVDEKASKFMWSKRFTEAQGFKVNLKFFQHDTSTIKLADNEKLSSGQRTRHFDAHLLHVAGLISRKEVTSKYCQTGKILADYFNKTLVGKLLHVMRSDAMNVSSK